MSKDEMISEGIGEAAKRIPGAVYVFSAAVYDPNVDVLHDLVDRKGSEENATIFLTTSGGDPHAAYRMACCTRTAFKFVRVVIAGRCKSAGTLVAIGGHEIAMGLWGELGPLDAQMARPDELVARSSGLEILGAWATTQGRGFDAFSQYLLELTAVGLGTKLAAEIAASLAIGILQPVAAQIDPMRLAEAERSIEIAKAYGERIREPNLTAEKLDTLVNGYPTHEFVIDRPEADKVFEKVEDLTEAEVEVATLLQQQYGIIRYPPERSTERFVFDVKETWPGKAAHEGDGHGEHQRSGSALGGAEQGVGKDAEGDQREPAAESARANGSPGAGTDEST